MVSLPQSALMPACLDDSGPALDLAVRPVARPAAGVLATTVMPISANFFVASGCASAALIALFSLSTTAWRRARRRTDADPVVDVHLGDAGFLGAGHIGEHRIALGARHHQGAQLAALDVRQRGGDRSDERLHLIAHQVRQHGAGALVRYVHDVHARCVLEQLACEVGVRAIATRAVVELAGLRLGQRDELLNVLRRHGGVHDQHVRNLDRRRDLRERLLWVERERGNQPSSDGVRQLDRQQSGSVWRRACSRAPANYTSATGAVVHHHRRTDAGCRELSECARCQVGASAGCVGNDDGDGLLTKCRGTEQTGRAGENQGATDRAGLHDGLLKWLK